VPLYVPPICPGLLVVSILGQHRLVLVVGVVGHSAVSASLRLGPRLPSGRGLWYARKLGLLARLCLLFVVRRCALVDGDGKIPPKVLGIGDARRFFYALVREEA